MRKEKLQEFNDKSISSMKKNVKKLTISLISFNALGLFNFDTFYGLFISRNILKRIAKTAELLKETQPDILALQEVHTYSVLKLLKTKLKSYPYVAYKHFLYGPKGGLVIFSKIPIENTQYINFKKRGTFLNKSFISHIIKNGILAIKVKQQPLYILDTYFTPNTDHDYSKNNRFARFTEAQIEQLAQTIKQLANKKCDVIIAGDFNTEKDSYLYKKFVRLAGVKDIFSNFSTPTQHQIYVPKDQRVKRIDFIFLFNQYAKATIDSTMHLFTEKVKITKSMSQYLSDHIALKTDLTFHFNDETAPTKNAAS